MRRDSSHALDLMVTGGVAIWQGMIGVLVKSTTWPPVATVWARCALTAALLLGISALRAPPASSSSGAPPRRDAATVWGLWLSGALLAGHWVTLFWAYRAADVGPVVVAVFTFPMIACLVEPWFFGERPKPRQLLAAFGVFAGIALMHAMGESGELDGPRTREGIAWGLVSAAFFAARGILSRKLLRRVSATRIMGLQAAIVTLLLLPSLAYVRPSHLNPTDLALLAVLGLLFTALPHTLTIWVFGRLSVAVVGIVGSLQTVSSIAMAWILLGEEPTWWVGVGATTVVAGVAWESLARRGPIVAPGESFVAATPTSRT